MQLGALRAGALQGMVSALHDPYSIYLAPAELAELASTIDSPELRAIALRLQAGLEQQGRSFDEMTAEELTAMSVPAEEEPAP